MSRNALLTSFAVFAMASACKSSSSPSDAGPVDAGGSTDSGAPLDSGVDGGQDAGPPGLTCGKLLQCDQGCSTNACTDGCYADSTAVAQGLFDEFDNCLNVACPSTDGGACANPNSNTCSTCDEQAAVGTCVSNLQGCENDAFVGPPNPDGGAVFPDAGQALNCGEYVACVDGCAVDAGGCLTNCANEATPTGLALAGVLDTCISMACPSTDGGPCVNPNSNACQGCVEQVTLAQPDTCATPYIACNSDRSNSPDGGSSTTVFVDGGVLAAVVGGLDQAASTLLYSNGYLYFTQVIDGSPVLRVRLSDLDAGIEQLGPGQPTPVSLAVDSANVYVWSVGSFQLNSVINNQDGALVQVPLDGGAALTLAQNIEVLYDAAYLNAVAIDSKHVYWVAGASGNDGAIMRVPIGGGSPTAVYTQQLIPQAVTTDGTNLYWADWGTFNAQGRSNNDGTLWQGPVDGGTALMLASGQEAPSAIAVDSSNVYWTNLGLLGADNFPAPNTGSVLKVPIDGGTVQTIASSQAVPVSIIVMGGTVYWSEYGLSAPGLIMSAPVGSTTLSPLVAGLNDPAALAVSPTTIYWTNQNSSPTDGNIMSLTPF